MSEERIYKVLLGPVVSEKAATLGDANQAVFKVLKNATKLEVKAAVEKIFSVKVKKVGMLTVKGKTKRTRYGMGVRSDWKKAYVRLEAGQEIDLAEAGVMGA